MPRNGYAKKKLYELLTGMEPGDKFMSRDLVDELSEECGYHVTPHVIGYILSTFETQGILEKKLNIQDSNEWILVRTPI